MDAELEVLECTKEMHEQRENLNLKKTLSAVFLKKDGPSCLTKFNENKK